jgi:mono/diheme cytochrome c family protein
MFTSIAAVKEVAMRKHLRLIAVTLCTALATVPMKASAATNSSSAGDGSVTPTSGESWLNHLHRPFGDTSMGKTGRLGPPPAADGGTSVGWELGFLPARPEKVTLVGADLYRLNCQGCHGEKGEGAPPEINSVINPVRATSIPLVVERMKTRGMDITTSDATELAKQSQNALLQRIHAGGESMPAFPQLNEAETRVLMAYLRQLAGVPGATQAKVMESPVRVGELIVKSTCHTCHDATGPNPTPQQLENGAMPPLETLPARVDELQLIRKVTSGAPVLMGTPATLHRGRMPVFYYLSRDEAADVYLYLTSYPPTQQQRAEITAVASTPQNDAGGGDAERPKASPPSAKTERMNVNNSARNGPPDWLVTLLLIGLGAIAMGLVIAAVGYAAYELIRLGNASEARQRQPFADGRAEREIGDLVAR